MKQNKRKMLFLILVILGVLLIRVNEDKDIKDIGYVNLIELYNVLA